TMNVSSVVPSTRPTRNERHASLRAGSRDDRHLGGGSRAHDDIGPVAAFAAVGSVLAPRRIVGPHPVGADDGAQAVEQGVGVAHERRRDFFASAAATGGATRPSTGPPNDAISRTTRELTCIVAADGTTNTVSKAGLR